MKRSDGALWYVEGLGPTIGPVSTDALKTMKLVGKKVRRAGESGYLDDHELWDMLGMPMPTPKLQIANYPRPDPEKSSKGVGGVKWFIPANTSRWAIASSYLGILSPCGVFAPFAVLTGIVALWDLRTNPHKAGLGRALFGLFMGLFFLLPFALLKYISLD